MNCRRREITQERKRAAEERRRLEEEKAKVCVNDFASLTMFTLQQDGYSQGCQIATQGGKNQKNQSLVSRHSYWCHLADMYGRTGTMSPKNYY